MCPFLWKLDGQATAFCKLLIWPGLSSLQSKLPPLVSERATQTLRKSTFRQAGCKTSIRHRSFLPSCIGLWNSLPVSCTSCYSPHTFIASSDKHFYSDMYCWFVAWLGFESAQFICCSCSLIVIFFLPCCSFSLRFVRVCVGFHHYYQKRTL